MQVDEVVAQWEADEARVRARQSAPDAEPRGNFGTGWGYGADPDVSTALFNAYAEAGGNFIDSADVCRAEGYCLTRHTTARGDAQGNWQACAGPLRIWPSRPAWPSFTPKLSIHGSLRGTVLATQRDRLERAHEQ